MTALTLSYKVGLTYIKLTTNDSFSHATGHLIPRPGCDNRHMPQKNTLLAHINSRIENILKKKNNNKSAITFTLAQEQLDDEESLASTVKSLIKNIKALNKNSAPKNVTLDLTQATDGGKSLSIAAQAATKENAIFIGELTPLTSIPKHPKSHELLIQTTKHKLGRRPLIIGQPSLK